ncbi:MAG: DUF554 domain-containing protein [Thermoguttaceae bacterium]|nr:DUF554 domain-containing protein [Thermoguttaceae bacterium]
MPAVFTNVATVLLGGLLGLFLREKIKRELATTVVDALGLATIVIGIASSLATKNPLCLIVSLALGTLIGALLKLDERIEATGEFLGSKLLSKNERFGKFAEGFAAACVIFCVGPMTVVGSLQAGIDGNYDVIFAKSALDFVSSTIFAAAMGVGVPFAALFVLVFQGGLTLLSGLLAPYLTEEVVAEFSAAGGAILIGLGINILEISGKKLKIADMTPAIFFPIVFLPTYHWLSSFT